MRIVSHRKLKEFFETKGNEASKVPLDTKEQYEYAQARIEELLPLVDGSDVKERGAVELSLLSEIVIEYEKEHFPIEKPTIAELIKEEISCHK